MSNFRKLFMVAVVGFALAMPGTIFAQDEVSAQQEPAVEESATLEPSDTEAPETTESAEEESENEREAEGADEGSEDDEVFSDNPFLNIMLQQIKKVKPLVEPSQIPSLMFTTGEHGLIIDARKGLTARPATETEIKESEEQQKDPAQRPPRGPREIALGGIVYVSSGDWTVWINGQKITPDRIPPEILDIHVHKDFIKLKWFDAYTNKIFPVKLRSHQRFNIDTRIFLPG